jgi:hypothetical protein
MSRRFRTPNLLRIGMTGTFIFQPLRARIQCPHCEGQSAALTVRY